MRKTTKIDLHIHTKGSDGWSSAEAIVEAALEAGLDGICITDHHRTVTKEGLEVAELARASGLLVFRGCEYSTAQGHVLVFGVDVADLKLGFYPEAQVVVDAVNAAGGACVVAHPFKGYKRSFGLAAGRLKGIAGIEAVNGQCANRSPDKNELARALARRKRLRRFGGSDAHHAGEVGVAYTVFARRIETEAEFIKALRRSAVRPVCSRKRLEALRQRWVGLKAWSPPFDLGLNDRLDLDFDLGQSAGDGQIEFWEDGSFRIH